MIGSYPRTQQIREERRARAEEVLARSAGLTPEERLAKLDEGDFNAARERLRLARKIQQAADAMIQQKGNKKTRR